MVSEWKEYKLSEIMEIIGGGTPKTSMHEYWNGAIPWLSVVDFGNDRKLVFDTEKKITEKGLKESSTKLLKKGQIIISARGTVGALAVLGKDMAFNQSCYGLNAKEDLTFNDYLYYLIKDNVSSLLNNTHGAVFDTITRETFDHISVELPPLSEQRAIASILSSLDDKIDLLHRQNKTLEALAETLFRQWFVEEAEEGWRVCRLREVCSLITDGKHGDCQNETNSGYFFISVKDVKDGKVCYDNARQITKSDFEETHRRTNLTVGDILITNSGTIGRMAIIRDIPETRRTTFQKSVAILKPRNGMITSKFLYCLLQENHTVIVELAGGTTQQNLLLGDLKEFEFKYPGDLAIKEFDVKITPCFEKMFSNDIQIRTLTRLRDTLLPKLMGGEVRVGN
jgi:type I restriction enzyme S subunit